MRVRSTETWLDLRAVTLKSLYRYIDMHVRHWAGYCICTVRTIIKSSLEYVREGRVPSLLGLGLPLSCMLSLIIYMAFRYKPHIFWSTAPFSMIFSAGESWMHALSTQASEKSVWLFSLFRFGLFKSRFMGVSILLRGFILIVSKIDLTWPNLPGPCGTLWSSHYKLYPI